MPRREAGYTKIATKLWQNHVETGQRNPMEKKNHRALLMSRNGLPKSEQLKHIGIYHRNTQHKQGALITASWLPENAKKKNWRPRFEVYNTTDRDSLRLQYSKRLSDVVIPNHPEMADNVRLLRSNAEDLHQLQHTPLLYQQWDAERKEEHPFATYDLKGNPKPTEPQIDFPRFYDKEYFAELDHWQARTNEERLNNAPELFIYFHFWAHDDTWVYYRRIDVWDYVKTVALQHLTARLETIQRTLYGKKRDYVLSQEDLTARVSAVKEEDDGSYIRVSANVMCWWTNPKKSRLSGAKVRWRPESAERWQEGLLGSEGDLDITASVLKGSEGHVEVEVEADGKTVAFKIAVQGEAVKGERALTPPSDLKRALPGWTEEEVVELYRQELKVLEEDIINTIANFEAMTRPTPIMYACQNELMQMGFTDHMRRDFLKSKKDFDWWFHHQSFSLYLPFHDEELLHKLLNWQSVLNHKVGNSPWIDQMKQYSPQPVNCLMQTFRKHNCVWDSRVFKIEHDVEEQFQEEHVQEWSYVEHRPDPQPTPPEHLRPRQPRPIELSPPPEVLGYLDTVRDNFWATLKSPTDKIKIKGQAEDYAEEYFRDTFAARKAAKMPFVHPDDQPGIETDIDDPEPEKNPGRERVIKRIGKLYRWYFNPYNPLPVRHKHYLHTSKHETDWWW
eukprot:Sspe_Gene.16283::Locus_5736_Transcript_1_1_Confidence_1.000_Length_2118::g.16283::m.16283